MQKSYSARLLGVQGSPLCADLPTVQWCHHPPGLRGCVLRSVFQLGCLGKKMLVCPFPVRAGLEWHMSLCLKPFGQNLAPHGYKLCIQNGFILKTNKTKLPGNRNSGAKAEPAVSLHHTLLWHGLGFHAPFGPGAGLPTALLLSLGWSRGWGGGAMVMTASMASLSFALHMRLVSKILLELSFPGCDD